MLELGSTVFTKFGVPVMSFGAALRTGMGGNLAFEGLRQFNRDDAGRNRNNTISNNHYCRGNQLAKDGLG